MATNAQRRNRLLDTADRLALATSAACLVHCLALPLLFAVLPVLSSVIKIPASLHLWLVAVAVPVSGYALLVGQRERPSFRPLFIGMAGLWLLAIGVFAAANTAWETPATAAGGLLVAVAHVLNWRRRHGVRAG